MSLNTLNKLLRLHLSCNQTLIFFRHISRSEESGCFIDPSIGIENEILDVTNSSRI